METSTQEIHKPAKASRTTKAPRIDALMMPQIEAFHGIYTADNETPGDLWKIDPRFGKGYYWNYIIDDMMVVTICELEFFSDVSFSYPVPDFFCFGKYNKNMSSYMYADKTARAHESILGYVWKKKVFSETAVKNTPLRNVSIALLPEAMQWFSSLFKVNPLTLASAISNLDGTQVVPGLSELFDSLFSIRPCNVAARTYYESKIMEACALLVDWQLLKQSKLDHSIRPADHSALNITLRYIHENLEKNITLKELCRLSCMSASKLTSLFKQTKHKSPIEYAKDAKMDYACRLLAEDTASIQEISSRLGFIYQGSFSEAFKTRYGISPRTYRRSHTIIRPLAGISTRTKTIRKSEEHTDPRKSELALKV